MNGFLYPLFDFIIVRFFYYTNIVELFKFIAKLIARCIYQDQITDEILITYANIGIDIYQIFKWSILIIFWMLNYNTEISKIIIFYLIYSNLFVYFYYHVWGE